MATTCGNQVWAGNAPAIFLVAYNSSLNTVYPELGYYDYTVKTDTRCVLQQSLLESSAIDLSANVVADGFESWNETTAQMLATVKSKFYQPYFEELQCFANCIVNDTSPSPSREDGLKDMEAISRAYNNQIELK
jgi:hypothetical protein